MLLFHKELLLWNYLEYITLAAKIKTKHSYSYVTHITYTLSNFVSQPIFFGIIIEREISIFIYLFPVEGQHWKFLLLSEIWYEKQLEWLKEDLDQN